MSGSDSHAVFSFWGSVVKIAVPAVLAVLAYGTTDCRSHISAKGKVTNAGAEGETEMTFEKGGETYRKEAAVQNRLLKEMLAKVIELSDQRIKQATSQTETELREKIETLRSDINKLKMSKSADSGLINQLIERLNKLDQRPTLEPAPTVSDVRPRMVQPPQPAASVVSDSESPQQSKSQNDSENTSNDDVGGAAKALPVEPSAEFSGVRLSGVEVAPLPPKISSGVLLGQAIKRVKPLYPQVAKTMRASGSVEVKVIISREGRVTEVLAANGHRLLQDAAVQAARKWIFTPTLLSNVPVETTGTLTFNFTLP